MHNFFPDGNEDKGPKIHLDTNQIKSNVEVVGDSRPEGILSVSLIFMFLHLINL